MKAKKEWLIDGYVGALTRLREAVAKGDVDPKDTFVPLAETLWWAVSISDRLGSRFKSGPEKNILQAVRFARNQVGHQWAAAVSLQDKPFPVVVRAAGSGGPTAPTVVKMWCWRRLSDLPRRPPKYKDPAGAKLYRKHLGGKLVLETLDAICEKLEAMR